MSDENSYVNLNYQEIFKNGNLQKSNYNTATVSPHILFENFFNEDVLNSVLNEFPNLESNYDNHYNDIYSKSFAKKNLKDLNKTKKFIDFLNSKSFIDFLQKLTGINEKLVVDPYMVGGGLHESKKGGYLKLHSDFYLQPTLKLDRRINMILYLNKNYKPEYKGEIYLYDKDLKNFVKYFPKFNSLFIFNTTEHSYHGFPEPIEMNSRKSVALYFYSKGRPKNERNIYRRLNSTYWVKQNNYQAEKSLRNHIKKFIKKNIPSLLLNFIK